MRVEKRLFLAVFLLALTPFPLRGAEKGAPAPATVPDAALEAVSEPDYRIGPGDVLNIEVWKDPALTRLVTVLPAGEAADPFVGEIVAPGETGCPLQTEVEMRLSF